MSRTEDAGPVGSSGHRLLPHTADVMLRAWAPSMEDCLTEAVRGLVSCFVEVREARPQRLVAFECAPGPEPELLVELLEEVIFLVDTQDEIPVRVAVVRTPQGGLAGEFAVVSRTEVTLVGSAPKAITRHGLQFEQHDSAWRCQVVIDV